MVDGWIWLRFKIRSGMTFTSYWLYVWPLTTSEFDNDLAEFDHVTWAAWKVNLLANTINCHPWTHGNAATANLNYLLQTCRSHLGSKARGAANFRKCLSMKHVGWNKCKVDMRRCSCWKWKKCPNHQPVYMLSRVYGESTQHSWVPGHVRSQPITWQQQLGMMINLDSYGLTHL